MNGKIHLEYKQYLKTDYTGNYIEIIYDEINNIFEKIYFYNFQYGIIDFIFGRKEIHKWETEDEAQFGSYLNRHYPMVCLDGITSDKKTENKIIEENMNYINKLNLENDKMKIIDAAVSILKNIL